MTDKAKPTNYWDYIRVEELLDLQGGLEAEESQLSNDEVVFITVHQVFELWFKLIIRELKAARNLFKEERVSEQELSGVVSGIRRIITILQRCADHFAVIETLTTRDYLAFRDKLMPASGFQSAQMRQIEILMGLDDEDRIPLGLEENYREALRSHDGTESSASRRVQEQESDRPTLADACAEWLYRTPILGQGPNEAEGKEQLERFLELYIQAHHLEVDHTCELALERTREEPDRVRLLERYAAEKKAIEEFLHPTEAQGGARRQRIRAAMLFIVSYRELPLLAWPREVLGSLIALEQAFLIFRQRHARMVERIIGRRTGTGGSAGVEYLDQTALTYRVFRDLWAVRTYQVRAEAIPPIPNPDYYDFRNG
ncbi:MAG: tryptophan 2,3-dioxygenase family protein [Planctomycetota bacterium]